jgi:hypothetical protein
MTSVVMSRAIVERLVDLLNAGVDCNDEHSLLANVRDVDAPSTR